MRNQFYAVSIDGRTRECSTQATKMALQLSHYAYQALIVTERLKSLAVHLGKNILI